MSEPDGRSTCILANTKQKHPRSIMVPPVHCSGVIISPKIPYAPAAVTSGTRQMPPGFWRSGR